jgi:hypothetical protein
MIAGCDNCELLMGGTSRLIIMAAYLLTTRHIDDRVFLGQLLDPLVVVVPELLLWQLPDLLGPVLEVPFAFRWCGHFSSSGGITGENRRARGGCNF